MSIGAEKLRKRPSRAGLRYRKAFFNNKKLIAPEGVGPSRAQKNIEPGPLPITKTNNE